MENKRLTLVTGLWNINRDSLKEGWSRSYEYYLQKFDELLKTPNNMIIYGDKELEKFVFERRKEENTQFIIRDVEWFKNEHYNGIQKIRNNSDWYNQVDWLKDSTQAKLEMYNPLVMSKPFLLHDAKILDKFNSTHLFWIDAGLTNTVNPGYFTHDKIIDKLGFIKKFTFITFPYDGKIEIHGFEYNELCNLAEDKNVDKVCRAGFFGGPKHTISQFNNEYYHLLKDTLTRGYMGTEESLFTILLYKEKNFYQNFDIDSNGLVFKFFEDIKTGKIETIMEKTKEKIGLYIITFNSPKQVDKLLQSMEMYDENFINKTKIHLLNNSSDLSTTDDYNKLCKEYNIDHIKKDNLGICGGRQFIAEHADEMGYDYYFFFEDDMFLYPNEGEVCKNGFNRFTKNLFDKSLEIIKKEGFDFLKLSFTEFFGDNSTQWAWYNVPQKFREKHWPNNKKLPERGLDKNAPKTIFNNIKIHKDLPYVNGQIYYCNWPQIVSNSGNYKMFLETKWGHPFEQTWMSHIFQETIKDNIKPGLLLLTPIEHDRFDHYDKKLRREN
jgi:hypothetical protein